MYKIIDKMTDEDKDKVISEIKKGQRAIKIERCIVWGVFIILLFCIFVLPQLLDSQ